MANEAFDLIIIGGGTAALAALSEALEMDGANRIALIEKRKDMGGECALFACVPTKALLAAAKLKKVLLEQAPQYGFEDIQYRFDFQTLQHKVEAIIQEGESEFLKDPRVTLIQGQASFKDPHTIQVADRLIRAEKIIIATGAEPRIPSDIEGLEETGYLTFRQATHLSKLPESLIIVGGGPVGVEFAFLFATLGCQVSLLESTERLLKHEEPEISTTIHTALERTGVTIFTGCDFQSARVENGQKVICFGCNDRIRAFRSDEILVAVGMKPRLQALNLDTAGIEYTKKGISVNDELRTNLDHIWAVGDVIGHYKFTHTADYEAVIATQNALKNAHRSVNYRGIGWAIHTIPITAHVQYTEAEARARFPNIIAINKPVDTVSRYRIESETEGFIKLIVDADTDQLVGGHLFAMHADDIAHLLMIAIRQHLTVEQLMDLIYIYPSRMQLVQKALEAYVLEKAKIRDGKIAAAVYTNQH